MKQPLARFTIIVTSLTKLAGLCVGFLAPHGALSPHPEAVVIAFSAFLATGAQVSKHVILGFLAHFFAYAPVDQEDGEA